jgi:hypothetical protein
VRVLVVLILVLAACAPAPAAAVPATSNAPTTAGRSTEPATTAAPVPTPAPLPHVFVVVMENAGLARALRSKPIAALASRSLLATNYRAVARPSLPNYLALTSGSTWDIADNGYHLLPAGGLGAQLTAAGVPWRAYMEGMMSSEGCMRSPYPYALKHNPFAYYGGGCPENVVPFEELDADLDRDAPRFVWITPGLCHDGHDCPVDEAASWLDGLVTRIVASRAWGERGVLLVVWDEGDGGDANLVPLIAATTRGSTGEIAMSHDHYSLLATIEDLFHLPRLGAAKDARPIAELLGTDQ